MPSLGDCPQVNAPLTDTGAIRGIHAERAHKLVAVGFGKIFAAIVDLDVNQLVSEIGKVLNWVVVKEFPYLVVTEIPFSL